jgi:hypothetical protein
VPNPCGVSRVIPADKQSTEGGLTMHHFINLKRSVATLASAAGLLAAAAGPAHAQVLPGTIGVTTPHAGHGHQVASDTLCTITCLDQDLTSLKLPAQSSSRAAGTTATIKRDAQDTPSILRWSLGSGGDDPGAWLSLKFDSNEVAELHAAQRISLGRENSIEI